jgi:CzcA family heavy metal efflux pump
MFAWIVTASLRGRVLVLALAGALLALGVVEARRLPVDVLPDLTRPMVMVQTEVPGFAPADVEPQVTFPIETALSGLQDVARLRSVSTPGLSVVYAEFGWDTDPWRDRQLVAERIDAIRSQLPVNAAPRLGPQTSLMGEILLVGLQYTPDGDAAMDVRDFADWTLRPRLLSLPGVAQVTVIGGQVRQYEVRPDLDRLRANAVSLAQVDQAVAGFGANSGGGVLVSGGAEYAVRGIGRPLQLEDLRQTAVAWRGSGAIRLGQVAELAEGARLPRGDAGVDGKPAVILSVQKQPGADTLALTAAAERLLAQADAGLPQGARRLTVFRQADFIRASVDNVREALLGGAVIAAVVLFLFLGSPRATAVSLAAIPLSLLAAVLVLEAFHQSIDTMTLGGLAIAVGELVDDAVVGVENVARRLRENALLAQPRPATLVIARATVEVRAGILYATLLVVLVFVPLFALEGVEGRLFAPLGLSYIAAILSSLVVAVTVTPALSGLAFAEGRRRPPPEPAWLQRLKSSYVRALERVLARPRPIYVAVALVMLAALLVAWQLPRAFLPAFNEGTLTINLLLEPGVSLAESDRVGQLAEHLALQVPEVAGVGRRTGRAEQDEHAEGLHYSELELSLRPGGRPREAVVADLRHKLSVLPASLVFGQPISHRLDHLLSGVRAPLAVKIYGEDLPTLRELAHQVHEALEDIPGLADVQVEKQNDAPELRVRVDARRAAEYGVSPPRVQDALAELTVGKPLSTIVEGERRYDLVVRLPQDSLNDPSVLKAALIDTPAGPVPLSWLADVDTAAGPSQILREDLRRRIVVSAFDSGGDFGRAAAKAKAALSELKLPPGYELRLEGEYAAQAQAAHRIGSLAILSLLLMAAVLYGRYRSGALTLIILGNVPLALAGGVAALALTRTPLSVASLVGFVTLAGIAARNGILKLSRYLDLAASGAEAFGPGLVLRGSAERLTPVLMTAGIAALALAPLLFAKAQPGKEILHPVALVIFGGLLVGTLLDSFLTPLLFVRFGGEATQRLADMDEPA